VPNDQILPTDALVVIRSGVPYSAPISNKYARGDMKDNLTETVITSVDTWEDFQGAITPDTGSNFAWFGNVLKYIGPDSEFPLSTSINFTVQRASGPMASNVQVGVFRNGVLGGIGSTMTLLGDAYGSSSFTGPVLFNQDDELTVKVRNRNNTSNIILTDLQVIVS